MTLHTIPQETVLYLIRHAEAVNNVRGILNALPDGTTYPLTERGRQQAQSLAEALCDEKITHLFVSPIRRAQETAQILSRQIGIKPVTDLRLTENGMGLWNGRAQSAFFARFPDRRKRSGDGVEPYAQEQARLSAFLKDLMGLCAPGSRIAIVSHAGPLRTLRGLVLALSFEEASEWNPANAECVRLAGVQAIFDTKYRLEPKNGNF